MRHEVNMNPQNLSRLQEEQEKALDETNANINQWYQYHSLLLLQLQAKVALLVATLCEK